MSSIRPEPVVWQETATIQPTSGGRESVGMRMDHSCESETRVIESECEICEADTSFTLPIMTIAQSLGAGIRSSIRKPVMHAQESRQIRDRVVRALFWII